MLHTLSLQTQKKNQWIDITSLIEGFLHNFQIKDGVAIIYCPHTTAGIAINENVKHSPWKQVLEKKNDE